MPPYKKFKPDFFASITNNLVPHVTQQWCNWEGKPTSFVRRVPSPQQVAALQVHASPSMFAFRDPSSFPPRQLHNNLAQWEFISEQFPSQDEPMCFIRNKVDVASFIVPFKGKFGGKFYDAPFPPRMEFPDNPICTQFGDFISTTIIGRFKNGSLVFWGKVGEVQPPHLIMPITIEPSKPRMCHDERFLNVWIKDYPFSLEYLSDLPRYVGPGHYQTVCDDKNGCVHICLTPSSRTLFGLSWRGCYFGYNTLPFGWKASAYVYHTTSLVSTSYIRTLGVPCSQYIDDRHAGQLVAHKKPNLPEWTNFELAEAAAFIVVSVLTSLGYPLALSKSSLVPSQCVRFLGCLSDSGLLAFVFPEDKTFKFKALRESILSQETADVKTLQRFAGKTTSFSIALGFIPVPRFVLSLPVLNHPISPLRSQATY